MPQPLAWGTLHPTAVGLRLGSLNMWPELRLRHGHQRRRSGKVVVMLVLLWLMLRRRLMLRGRLVWRLEGRLKGWLVLVMLRLLLGLLRLGLWLMRWWQRRMQGSLKVRLCMCRQERLSWAG